MVVKMNSMVVIIKNPKQKMNHAKYGKKWIFKIIKSGIGCSSMLFMGVTQNNEISFTW